MAGTAAVLAAVVGEGVLAACSVALEVLCGFKLALPYFPRILVARVGRSRFFNRESVKHEFQVLGKIFNGM